MTEEEIKEGNIIILKYLGYKKGINNTYLWTAPNVRVASEFGVNIFEGDRANGCRFHYDWNPLMKLVLKVVKDSGDVYEISSNANIIMVFRHMVEYCRYHK